VEARVREDEMAEGFQSSADEAALKQVLALARKERIGDLDAKGEPTAAFAGYVTQLVRFATGEDRIWDDPRELLERAQSAWTASSVRKPGEHLVKLALKNAADWRLSRLVLDIVTDDRPFLVDSITAALAEAAKPVSFFINAVVACERDASGRRGQCDGSGAMRESMIHAEMDPPTGHAEIEILEAELHRVLDDVAHAVDDWQPMEARLGACISQLERARPEGVGRDDQREAVEFLKWLRDNRFAFLGVRRYRYKQAGDRVTFDHDPSGDLGILRDPGRRILKSAYSEGGHLSPAVEAFMRSGEPILVAKANAKSLVHRRAYMDYIGVKTYTVDGKISGEERFVGLFAADAYNRPASDIPLLRAKMRRVADIAGFQSGGHNEKALLNILETFPRDEMFQIDVDALRETALGILRLYKRPRPKLFLRRDRFDRFVSVLVYIPRDRFNSDLREKVGAFLATTYAGRVSAHYPWFGEAALVRVHYIIGIDAGAPEGPPVQELTQRLRAMCLTWNDGLLDALREARQGATPVDVLAEYGDAFDAAYREDSPASEALIDIDMMQGMGARDFALRVFRWPQEPKSAVRIKIYRRGGPMRLSSLIPTLENLGLSAVQEQGYDIRPKSGGRLWMHDFHADEKLGREIAIDDVKKNLEDAMSAVMEGRAEDDGFNALVVDAGLNWREAWMLRAVAKYLLQAGIPFSQKYIEEALIKHPKIARELISVFHARFNPAGARDPDKRAAEAAKAEAKVLESLESVQSLDEDRIMRRFLNLFGATLRTNYYQKAEDGGPKSYISFKIDSSRVEGLREPRPYREIFVCGPRVDGVHLRFGPVARGGLRWSDRREDYRTEVLGLVKAQRVKNAVIVPTGSKGGFYPKQLPVGGDRAAVFEEGREAYKVFIRGLLDLTDTIVAGEVKPPPSMVLWDDADPYLVVAADKGTATFSDTANAISAEYGFWLGDAFASGGSAGYDHKVMGITARGGWEAVKRHFREMGKDIQTEPFTVVGVGDMSGDVFGNGMLLSKQTKLVAAFDHRDIFVDPDPDAAKSYAERARMFALPRSSWQDYDRKAISRGGGVFSRSAKSIPVSAEMKSALGLKSDKATPAELMRAILLANADLMWLGGIGTFIKASVESHAEVGDRANEAVRIDARELRVKVIGEGANLGLTQAARIEFARAGGRLNTDAIDNSAGVDSSDHEVNIKILLSAAIERGDLKVAERNPLLSSMTEDVAAHVLRHNYDQTRAISMMEATAAGDLDGHARLMDSFEESGRLDRAVEGLPAKEAVEQLRARKLGLTRPELAVLLAYSKMWLFETLVESKAPDDPLLEGELFAYFPEPAHRFKEAIVRHRLRREIIATRLANEIVDTCGASFPYRVVELTGADPAQVALAYEAARRILKLGQFAEAVDALDNKAPAALQVGLYNSAADVIREQLYRIVCDAHAMALLEKRGLKGLMQQYEAPVRDFKAALDSILPKDALKALRSRAARWKKEGAPEALAEEAAHFPALERAFDVINLARETGWSTQGSGAVFFAVGRAFDIDVAREHAKTAPPQEHFDRLAAQRLIEDLSQRQSALARSVIASAGKEPSGPASAWLDDLLRQWRKSGDQAIDGYGRFVAEIELGKGVTVGKLSLLNKKLADIAERLMAA
jgi:glutamate dehydrogenase